MGKLFEDYLIKRNEKKTNSLMKEVLSDQLISTLGINIDLIAVEDFRIECGKYDIVADINKNICIVPIGECAPESFKSGRIVPSWFELDLLPPKEVIEEVYSFIRENN